MPATIVIGFDGTDSGEDALALGLLLARATQAVPLVAVVHPQEYPIGVGRVDAEWVAYMHEQATELLGRARRLATDDAGAEFREVSAPSESRGLHELAEREQAELVVVGSSSRGPMGRTYPGSTGERLLQGSACPVAVAPRGLRESPPERLASVVPRPAEVYLPVIGRDAEAAFVASSREVFQAALAKGLARVAGRSRPTPSCSRAGWSTPWPRSTGATPTCWSAGPGPTGPCGGCCWAGSPPGCCAVRRCRWWSCRAAATTLTPERGTPGGPPVYQRHQPRSIRTGGASPCADAGCPHSSCSWPSWPPPP